MTLPVTIPNTFANATSSIPLSQLDANFSTLSNVINQINAGTQAVANLTSSNVTITGGTIANVTLDNVTVDVETLSNVTINGGNVTVTNMVATTANATTGNITTVNATTIDTTNIEVTNIKAKDGTAALSIADSTGVTTQSTPAVISVNSSSDALRITQTGAGNALVVEDSANPDSTPFVIAADGKVGIGLTTPTQLLEISNDGVATQVISRYSTDANPPRFNFQKSRGTAASPTIVGSDNLAEISGAGYDGASFLQAARIDYQIDGTPASNNMPGRLLFLTRADGGSGVTERMRIDSAGNVGIGGTTIAGFKVANYGNLSGATSSYSYYSGNTFQSGVTTLAIGFGTFLGTQATSFTLATLSHLRASQGTIGAGSTVTNQYGFEATSSLIGATNNFGFYSNIASGTGRWNFYANGTAANYFGGHIYQGNSTQNATRNVRLGATITGGTSAYNVLCDGAVQTDVTTNAYGIAVAHGTAASASITNLYQFYANQGTFGASTTVTNQFGFIVDSSLTGATNNYGFYSNIASGTGRWNFYAAGTAANYFGGDVQFKKAIVEEVYTITDGAAFEIDPSNGTMQLITLGASRTPKATNFAAGESITLMVNDGSAYTITWTDATWGGSGVVWLTNSGTAPTLATTGYTTIVLWKVGSQVYGARVGDNA